MIYLRFHNGNSFIWKSGIKMGSDLWKGISCIGKKISLYIDPQVLALISTTSPLPCCRRGLLLITTLWAHNPYLLKNSCCSYLKNSEPIMSQFCTCHDSSAVMVCAKLWPDWTSRITIRIKRIFTRFQWWAREVLVKWLPDHGLSWPHSSWPPTCTKATTCHCHVTSKPVNPIIPVEWNLRLIGNTRNRI